MIIDFHTHIFSEKVINERDEYCRRDLCFSALYSNLKAKMATIEDLIHEMDECNIDKSIILNIGWTDNETCRETNDYILESQSRYPKRIVGFCTVQPLAGDNALKELERCMKGGACGLGEMRPDLQDFNACDAAIMDNIVNFMIKNKMLFLVHSSEPVGHCYDGKGKITPGLLYAFIARYPQLKVVCAHLGGGLPFYSLMPEVNAVLANVYYDTAATPYLYKPEIIKHLAEIAGLDKLLFGSDYPLMSPRKVVSYIDSVDIEDGKKSSIYGENAIKLLEYR